MSGADRVRCTVLAVAAGCLLLAPASAWVFFSEVHRLPLPQQLVELVGRGLGNWDGGWYAQIAQSGYWYHPGAQSPVAFFPLYPLLIRGLTQAGVNLAMAATAISWLS